MQNAGAGESAAQELLLGLGADSNAVRRVVCASTADEGLGDMAASCSWLVRVLEGF